MIPLKAAIKVCGSRAALAKRLGIQRQAVYQWKGRIPVQHWWNVSQMTGIPYERIAAAAKRKRNGK